MNRTERDKTKLMDYIKEIEISKAIELEESRAENARLRREVLLRDAFIEASDEQYDRLMVGVTGRLATVTPPIQPGITRVNIGGITEIVDESDIR